MEKCSDIKELIIPNKTDLFSLEDISNLFSKEDIYALLKEDKSLNKEQLEYLKSLLELEISVFQHNELNKKLFYNPLFIKIAQYNLYENILKILKESNSFDKNSLLINLDIVLKNYLDIFYYEIDHNILIKILDIDISKYIFEITLYHSDGYNEALERELINKYIKSGFDIETIKIMLDRMKIIYNITNIISTLILKEWKINFNDKVWYDKNVAIKKLSWSNIYIKEI